MDQHASVMWEAELYRLKGELLLAQSPEQHTEVTTCFQHSPYCSPPASQIAGTTGCHEPGAPVAAPGEDRARPSVADSGVRLFTEGFDTADLQEAKALLEQLA